LWGTTYLDNIVWGTTVNQDNIVWGILVNGDAF
jgi:hypothetical protein